MESDGEIIITYDMAQLTCCADELDSWVAKYAPGKTELSCKEIVELALTSSEEEKSSLVIYLTDLPVDLGMQIADTVEDLFNKGRIARFSELPKFYRIKLAMQSTNTWKKSLIRYFRADLTPEQLEQLNTAE